METTTRSNRGLSNRTLLLAGIAVAVVVALTAVLAVNRQPVTYPRGSPEAAVQAYVQAMLDGDEDTAAAWLDPDMECDAAHLADADVPDDVRVTLRHAEVDGDVAEVEIGVTVTSGRGPFDTYEYEDHHRFELAQSDGGWLITTRPWPWASCWR